MNAQSAARLGGSEIRSCQVVADFVPHRVGHQLFKLSDIPGQLSEETHRTLEGSLVIRTKSASTFVIWLIEQMCPARSP